MIVSYLHNFIFIKTKKTAGTTVEMMLAPFCGPNDIVTPLGTREELTRGKGEPLCRNFSDDPAWEDRLRSAMKSGLSGPRRRAIDAQGTARFFNHITASRIRPMLAPDFWERAVKITTVRHPYEKAVSFAYFTFAPQRRAGMSFKTHLDAVVRGGGYLGHPHYTIGDEVVVTVFIRQEALRDDLKQLGARLGLSIPDEIVQSKHRKRTDRRPAREILSDAQKEIVFTTCRKEFDLLGYEI